MIFTFPINTSTPALLPKPTECTAPTATATLSLRKISRNLGKRRPKPSAEAQARGGNPPPGENSKCTARHILFLRAPQQRKNISPRAARAQYIYATRRDRYFKRAGDARRGSRAIRGGRFTSGAHRRARSSARAEIQAGLVNFSPRFRCASGCARARPSLRTCEP